MDLLAFLNTISSSILKLGSLNFEYCFPTFSLLNDRNMSSNYLFWVLIFLWSSLCSQYFKEQRSFATIAPNGAITCKPKGRLAHMREHWHTRTHIHARHTSMGASRLVPETRSNINNGIWSAVSYHWIGSIALASVGGAQQWAGSWRMRPSSSTSHW